MSSVIFCASLSLIDARCLIFTEDTPKFVNALDSCAASSLPGTFNVDFGDDGDTATGPFQLPWFLNPNDTIIFAIPSPFEESPAEYRSITIILWIFLHKREAYCQILEFRNDCTRGLRIYISHGTLFFGQDTPARATVALAGLTLKKWHIVVARYKYSSGIMSLRIFDSLGDQLGQNSRFVGHISLQTQGLDLVLGDSHSSWTGKLYCLQLYSSALPDAVIRRYSTFCPTGTYKSISWQLKGISAEFQVIRGFSQKIPADLLSYDKIHS